MEANASPPSLEKRLAQRSAMSSARPVMYQRWSELLFLHWSVDPAVIQETLPEGLSVDTYEGRAWIGLVPFRMEGIRPRCLPAVPWLSAFPELNVRTYVLDESGRPGVWFYSLDAARWLAVKFARAVFRLPYFHAQMKVNRDPDSGWIDYCSRRREGSARASFRFRGIGVTRQAEPGTLEFFLLERYLLFASIEGGIGSGYVSHQPYAYRAVELPLFETEPISAAGLPEPVGFPEHAAYVESVDVSIFPLEGQASGRAG